MSGKGFRTVLILGAIAAVLIAGRSMLPASGPKTVEPAGDNTGKRSRPLRRRMRRWWRNGP